MSQDHNLTIAFGVFLRKENFLLPDRFHCVVQHT